MGASPREGVLPPGEMLNNATVKVRYVTMVWPVLEVGHLKSEIAFNIKTYPIFQEQNPKIRKEKFGKQCYREIENIFHTLSSPYYGWLPYQR